MGKKPLLTSVFAILVILFLTYALTVFSPQIRDMTASLFHMKTSDVLGEQTAALSPTQQVRADIKKQQELVTHYVLGVTLGDVLDTLSRSKKIVEDIQEAQVVVQEQINKVSHGTKTTEQKKVSTEK